MCHDNFFDAFFRILYIMFSNLNKKTQNWTDNSYSGKFTLKRLKHISSLKQGETAMKLFLGPIKTDVIQFK